MSKSQGSKKKARHMKYLERERKRDAIIGQLTKMSNTKTMEEMAKHLGVKLK